MDARYGRFDGGFRAGRARGWALALALGLGGALSLGACHTPLPSVQHAVTPPPGFAWPVPDRWRREAMPMPLAFAPEVAMRGVEEIRFAPGFFKPGTPGYWSYAFAWVVDDHPSVEKDALERDLAAYFAGLTRDVGKGRFDLSRVRAALSPASQPGVRRRLWRGTVDTYDPFATLAPLTLQVEVETWYCLAAARQIVLVAASPRPYADPIWNDLHAREASLSCN